MEKDRLKGVPLDRFKMAWDSAAEYVKDKPDLTVIEDLESSYPMVVTKKYAESLADIFESCMPKSTIVVDSKLFYFGTGGEIKRNNDWLKIFEDGETK